MFTFQQLETNSTKVRVIREGERYNSKIGFIDFSGSEPVFQPSYIDETPSEYLYFGEIKLMIEEFWIWYNLEVHLPNRKKELENQL